MNKLILMVALFTLGGCNAVNKLTGNVSEEHHNTATSQDFFGIVNGPSPMAINETPNAATTNLVAFVCTNACVKTDLPAYEIPVYESAQPGITTPYAIWNYTSPNLQVVFENYIGSDTVQYVIRSQS